MDLTRTLVGKIFICDETFPVYFFFSNIFEYTQQETVEYTNDIVEKLSTRLVPKTLGGFLLRAVVHLPKITAGPLVSPL